MNADEVKGEPMSPTVERANKVLMERHSSSPSIVRILVGLVVVLAVLFTTAATLAAVFAYQLYNPQTDTQHGGVPVGTSVALNKRQRARPINVSHWSAHPSINATSGRRMSTDSGALEGAAWADYSASVTIDGQRFELIIDTGSSTFAVAASDGIGCSPHFTGTCNGQSISNQYGSGSWGGRVCSGHHVTFDGAAAGSVHARDGALLI
jgi:hypothetical protein